MQKKLIALAIAGLASGAAFAQSNVTIYGIADGTFDVVKSSSSTASGTTNTGSFQRVSANSSYIGFKGAEDLGNGLKAVFQFENGVNFDATGGTWASRDSFVGVAGGFGTVVMGNLTGPTRALGAAVDVNAGATGIGANSGIIGKIGGGNGVTTVAGTCTRSTVCTSMYDTRWANAIAYVSPNFSGFSGVAAYVANENKTNVGADGTAAQANTWGYDLGLNYNNGPIMVGLAYNAVKAGNTAGLDANNVRIAGSYDFGMASVRLLWERTKMNQFNAAGDDTRSSKWGVGGTFNVTSNGQIIAQYYHANDRKGSGAAGSLSDSGARLWEVGYVHNFSKRTSLRAVYAQIRNDDNANYDFGVNAVGTMGVAAAAIGNGSNVSGLQMGLRHSF